MTVRPLASAGRLAHEPVSAAPSETPHSHFQRTMTEPRSEVTRLVHRWGQGEEGAFDRLMELVYDELHEIAHYHLELGARDEVLDTTVLVHEAYLRLARVEDWEGRGRAQFFAFCSRAMRHILIDFARHRRAAKRGGAIIRVPLQEEMATVDAAAADLLVVEQALKRLESKDARMSQVFECRYFGGMSVQETAAALNTSTRTVEREWAKAKAYLSHALEYGDAAGGMEA